MACCSAGSNRVNGTLSILRMPQEKRNLKTYRVLIGEFLLNFFPHQPKFRRFIVDIYIRHKISTDYIHNKRMGPEKAENCRKLNL